MKNTDKIALITGANQGIGFAVAELLLQQKVKVILTSRNETKGNEAVQKLSKYENCFFHQLDVTDTASIQKAKTSVEEKFEKLDILINNAGINYDTWQNVLDADLQEAQQTFDTNLMGAWRTTQIFTPLLRKSKNARVVNVSSRAGTLSSQNGNTPAYSLSKLAMNGLTMQFASLLKKDNILVNCVSPGWVRTSMGGMGATRSPQEGAATVVWVALLEDKSLTGKFFGDKKIIDW